MAYGNFGLCNCNPLLIKMKAENLDKSIPGTSDQSRGPEDCMSLGDVHSLVSALAQCRLRSQTKQDGRPVQGSDKFLYRPGGVFLSRIRQVRPGNKQLVNLLNLVPILSKNISLVNV